MTCVRGILDLYISDHPLECESCPASGHCELQDMAEIVGIETTSYTGGGDGNCIVPSRRTRATPILPSIPRLCIVCSPLRPRPCDRSSGYVRAHHSGARLRIEGGSASQDQPFIDSECVSCGACVESCPTAALTEKIGHWPGSATEHAINNDPAPTAVWGCRPQGPRSKGEDADRRKSFA